MLTKEAGRGARESVGLVGRPPRRAPALRPGPVRVFYRHRPGLAAPAGLASGDHRAGVAPRPGGRLGESAPASGATGDVPATTPPGGTTTGDPLLSSNGGYRDDSRLATRADVLCFTGAPHPRPLRARKPRSRAGAQLSDNYVDVFVRVSGWTRRAGPAMSATATGIAGDAPELVRVELDAIAHRFHADSRIRVLIAGSWFPPLCAKPRHPNRYSPDGSSTGYPHPVHFGRSRLLPVG
ncbi:hypothetical protein ABLN97_02990 [Mycobacterium tuberculosis]